MRAGTTLVLKMASNTSQESEEQWIEQGYLSSSSDEDDDVSLATDDGQEHPPEKILAEYPGKLGFIWYLVKWKDCPVLRSSWEAESIFRYKYWLYTDWTEEKNRQRKGESKAFDIEEFNTRVLEVEEKERQKRRLRRLKRKIERVVEIVTA